MTFLATPVFCDIPKNGHKVAEALSHSSAGKMLRRRLPCTARGMGLFVISVFHVPDTVSVCLLTGQVPDTSCPFLNIFRKLDDG